ncbi:T-cell activation Rho GTPase-activating protein isoform X2 [Hemicordylus capensis]|nr:T-cell activation Rho GTPase-activating protein isoform X2 [Hemicordylus capensis]
MPRRVTAGSPEALEHLESDLKPSLFDQPLSIVCNEEDMLTKPMQDILTILYMKGPFTEGIFRKAANEKARKELKEELNSGGNVILESKSMHLLAVVFKDFLRNIPHKLLLSELYDEWMAALEKTTNHERIEAMKEVADKLPRPNLLLLKYLLCVLYHISKKSEVNKMDSSNLAICIGPNILTADHDQSLPLEVQKELTDKVKTLVEFLIDNCSNIFGEEISSLFNISADDKPEMLSSSQKHDSAYDSIDLEGECNSSNLQLNHLQQAEGTTLSRLDCTEVHSHQPLDQTTSASSLAHLKKAISNLDRRFSEPDMFSSQGCQEDRMRSQKLTKSEESFIQKEELRLKCQGLKKAGYFSLAGPYRNKKPPHLKASLQTELSSSSLPRTSSSSSLDSCSSISDGSVFTSSPLASPSVSKKNVSTWPQSLSTKLPDGSDISNRELKKHSMSFSVVNCKKVLTKTQSCNVGGFQRDSFKKDSKRDRHLSCRIVQGTCAENCNTMSVGCRKSRFMSADEVFRLVDQKNPGKPPSYEEATKNCSAAGLPTYGSLTVQNMRSVGSHPDSDAASEPRRPRLNRDVPNKVYKDLFNDRLSVITDSEDKTQAVDVVIGIHTRANLPLTPQVYRLRTMSGSYQKNKQEYLMRRCSQPAFDHIPRAKESYV